MSQPDTIMIDDVKYVREDSIKSNEKAECLDGMPYVIVRTSSAGVFAGHLKKKEGQNAVLLKVRRLWRWYGAASLSQLAMEGTSRPSECKFPCEVDEIELDQVIEVAQTTQVAKDSIASVPVWEA